MQYDPTDTELVVFLAAAGGCSLATKPGNKDNWIERAGSGGKGGKLPNYICKIAKALMKDGKSKSQAISIAISRTKAWAAGGDDVKADTRAKAAKAIAQWEALKAKNKAGKVVKASSTSHSGAYLFLTNVGVFDTDRVRNAWNEIQREASARFYARERAREERSGSLSSSESVSPAAGKFFDYFYIKSLWTTFIIVYSESDSDVLYKIPYTVEGDDVEFGTPQAVHTVYAPVEGEEWDEAWSEGLYDDDEDVDLTEDEILLLADLIKTGA